MRVIGEIAHPQCKISIFSWNQKYLIKIEQGPLEQTFKIDHLDVSSAEELKTKIDEKFITQALSRFNEMASELIKLTN